MGPGVGEKKKKNEDRKKGRKEGRREGRKEGKIKRRKERRKERKLHFGQSAVGDRASARGTKASLMKARTSPGR